MQRSTLAFSSFLFAVILPVATAVITCNKTPADPDDQAKIFPVINSHTPDTSVGISDTVELAMSVIFGSNDVVTYYWKSTLLQKIDSTADSMLFTVYTAAGNDTVSIWVCDGDGRISDSSEIYLSVHEWAPYFTALAADTLINEGDTAIIRVAAADSNSDTSHLRYLWVVDDDSSADTTDSGVFRVAGLDTSMRVVLVKVIDMQGNSSAVDTIRVSVCSSNAHLAGFAVFGASSEPRTFSPLFSPDTLLYRDTIDHLDDTIYLIPSAADSGASIRINDELTSSGAKSSGIAVGTECDTVAIMVVSKCRTDSTIYRLIILRLQSSNAKLKSLKVSAGTLMPSFASETLTYTDTVPFEPDTVSIIPFAEDAGAIVTVDGDTVESGDTVTIDNLAVGTNTISVRMVAADGTTEKIYAIMLYRQPDTNTELELLEVSSGTLTPGFDPGVFVYRDTVGDMVDSVSVRARAKNGNCNLYLNGSALIPDSMSPKFHLAPAALCTLSVTAALMGVDLATVYRIIVFRRPSTNANLKSLGLTAGTLVPPFSSETFMYTDTVSFELDTASIIPVAEDAGAIVTVDGDTVESGDTVTIDNLAVGTNTISVRMVAADGITEKIYAIMLYRQPDTNTELELLEVSSGTLTPGFDPGVFVYRDTVGDMVDSISVRARAKNGNCNLYLNGSALTPGAMSNKRMLSSASLCTLSIKAALPDGMWESVYTIIVLRQCSAETRLARLTGIPENSLTLQPSFNETAYDYYDTITHAQVHITIAAEPKHPRAMVTINGAAVNGAFSSGPIDIAVGDNLIKVKVAAENGFDSSAYVLHIFREHNDDPILSGLTVSSGALAPAFKDSTYLYTIEFAHGTSSFILAPVTRDVAAQITVSSKSLSATMVASGQNSPPIPLAAGEPDTVDIVVTAENGDAQKTYRIAVSVSGPPVPVILPATISANTILTDIDTYYTAASCITIPAGVTLTVNEGVSFRFRADTGAVINVFGTLIINGTQNHLVEFDLLDDPANRDTSRWGYISSTSGTLDLNYVRITNAHRFVSANYGNVHLNRCYVDKTYWTGTLDCVGVHYAADLLVEYCEFHGNPDKGADCVDLDSVTHSGIVRNNTFCDFADDGVDIGTGSPSFLIENNIIRNCSFGISVGEYSTVAFTRNIVASCRDGAMQSHTGAVINASNNTFYKNLKGVMCYRGTSAGSINVKNTVFSGTTGTLIDTIAGSGLSISYSVSDTNTLPGATNLFGDPRLSDPANGNFNLSSNSPCINNGDPADPDDVCGTRVDIGAIEYDCSP